MGGSIPDQEPQIWGMGATVFGREIVLDIGKELDECNQFLVRLSVDGKERWAAWFTDRSDEEDD